jgi:16S rRNA (guanine(966)-N(2))-methyltransferase RsmD
MRIIAGRLRRRSLRAPKGQLTRPTSDRTREAIFNLLQSRLSLEGAEVLDLFAGTGALGLEAISRGAAAATFVEHHPAVLQVARRNAQDLEVADLCRFLRADAAAYLDRYGGPPYDVIFADPPYDLDGLAGLPDQALPHLRPDGLFVLEHDARLSFGEHPRLDTSRSYGRTVVSLFRSADPDAAPEA